MRKAVLSTVRLYYLPVSISNISAVLGINIYKISLQKFSFSLCRCVCACAVLQRSDNVNNLLQKKAVRNVFWKTFFMDYSELFIKPLPIDFCLHVFVV